MIASPVIRKTAPTLPGLDFTRLRREGIERIIALGSDLWTDFNVHDPGITFLEVLCYAINDLSYRASLPIEDLLATRSGTAAPKGMPLAPEVLVNNPVTALDWRKVLIDIEGVKNAWVGKSTDTQPGFSITGTPDPVDIAFGDAGKLQLNGLLRVLIDYDDELLTDRPAREQARKAVERKLHSYRNLCEDLAEITAVPETGIVMCANIEIPEEADPDEVYATIIFEIQNFLTPSPLFFGLEEMFARKGTRSFDEIFDGPILENGFLDEADLLQSELRDRINVSDLYQITRKIEGTERIWGLQVKIPPGAWTEQQLILEKGKAVLLTEESSIQLSRRGKPVAINRELAGHFLDKLKAIHKPGSAHIVIDYPDAKAHPELGKYFSIQNDLPHTYHVDEDGIERSEPASTQAKVRQLKGFLVFFDQILANYLAHLVEVRSLLGMEQGHESPTLFSQPLYDSVTDLGQVLIGFDEKTGHSEAYDNFLKNGLESAGNTHIRRNAILNHMLARFGETFADFALTQFFDDPRTGWTQEDYALRTERNLEEKSAFLQHVAALGSERGKGFDYKKLKPNGTPDVWDTDNVEGLKKRVCQLLGVRNFRRQTLTCEQQYEIESRNAGGKYSFFYKNKKSKTVLLEAIEQINSERIDKSRKTVIDAVGKIENYQLFQNTQDDNEPIEPPATYPDGTDFVLQKEKGGTYRLIVTDVIKKTVARSYTSFSKKGELKAFLEKLENTSFNDDCANEGFHIIEHILLRPRIEKCCTDHPALLIKNHDKAIPDPYSFWITVVVPSAWKRFNHPTNRAVFEQTLRAEAPAHVAVRICWLTNDEMYAFEFAYGSWLSELANARPDRCGLDEYSKKLTDKLNDLTCTGCCTETIIQPKLNCL